MSEGEWWQARESDQASHISEYFQMTQRLDLYAESLAKAIDHDYKPDIIH